MHRFYGVRAEDGFRLPPEEMAHAKRVLRLRDGDEIELLCEGRAYRAALEGERARVIGELPSREAAFSLTLYQGALKGDKMEFVAQKACELGVRRFVPVVMARSVSRPDERRRERLARAAAEACKQCGRAGGMEVSEPMPFGAARADFAAHALRLLAWEEARGTRMRDAYAECPDASDAALLIGPEGGVEQSEAETLASDGARVVTLGPRILRAETAAVAACALAMSLWGDV